MGNWCNEIQTPWNPNRIELCVCQRYAIDRRQWLEKMRKRKNIATRQAINNRRRIDFVPVFIAKSSNCVRILRSTFRLHAVRFLFCEFIQWSSDDIFRYWQISSELHKGAHSNGNVATEMNVSLFFFKDIVTDCSRMAKDWVILKEEWEKCHQHETQVHNITSPRMVDG